MANTPLTPELRDVLSTLAYDGSAPRFTAEITEGQLPAKLYAQFKRVLQSIGGKWESRAMVHSFPHDPQPLVQQILDQGYIPDLNPLDYFPTPPALVQSIIECMRDDIEYVNLLRESEPMRVLDPEAGTGAFADALAEVVGTEAVLCLELNPVNVATLRGKGHIVEQVDFLQWESDERFRVIIMNPPFDGNTWKKHLRHAYKFLAPGGNLVCIAPKSITTDPEFLGWVLARGSVEENESKSFKASGTNVDTVTLFMRWDPSADKRKPTQGYPSHEAMFFDVAVSNDAKYQDAYERATALFLASSTDVLFPEAAGASLDEFGAALKELGNRVMAETFALCTLDSADIQYFATFELNKRREEQASEAGQMKSEQQEVAA